MSKRVLLLILSVLLMLGLTALTVGCTDDEPDESDYNPVQTFIDENREMLYEASQEHLEDLGPGATVDFEAGDNEFIYVYTFGSGPSADELLEFATPFLEFPSNVEMYENLARGFADMMELENLTLTVRYYDAQGNYIISRSYESR
ncbi:MAG: DUF4854 domain-containing protein [Coriobacteriia bacterium]|nr:DUF4854 domain-containing protein [Coriobacteriia bacterium]